MNFSKRVVFIVDGEVAYSIPAVFPEGHPAIEKFEAVFASNPSVLVADDDVLVGYTWDGNTFSPPVE